MSAGRAKPSTTNQAGMSPPLHGLMHGTLPGINHAREEHPGAHRLTKARIDQSYGDPPVSYLLCWRARPGTGTLGPEPGHPARNERRPLGALLKQR